MNKTQVDYYLDYMPAETRAAIMALDNDQKWAIYLALSLEGQKYFNELKKQFDANANTIDPILKSLIAGGLVARKVKQLDSIGKGRCYYQTTKLGLDILDVLYDVTLPSTKEETRLTHLKDVVSVWTAPVFLDPPTLEKIPDTTTRIVLESAKTNNEDTKCATHRIDEKLLYAELTVKA